VGPGNEHDSLEPIATNEKKKAETTSVYAESKLNTERYSLILGEAHGIPTVALRFFNAYGPRQCLSNPYTGALAIFACRILNGHSPLVYEDGAQSRDFIHVADVARAVRDSAVYNGFAGAYNVCTGVRSTVLDLIAALNEALAAKGVKPQKPKVLNVLRSGDIRHCFGDPAALYEAADFRAVVGLKEGVADTVDWIVQQQLPQDLIDRAMGELTERHLVA
jgi:dTDP-L-rhamnose 4-epimerase